MDQIADHTGKKRRILKNVVITSMETGTAFPFPVRRTAGKVCTAVLKSEHCPYNTEVSLTIVDSDEIQELNREYRGIDRPTDVLSFPGMTFRSPGEWPDESWDSVDPDSGRLMLGDIVINADRVFSQAQEYGHSVLREFAFLVAHSMLHLCGYDHETLQEAAVMEKKQADILTSLGILRE